uniref:Uncharacterized protein n=1 Tax=Globodera rostochiensis TaxID=31243 RepID=A0A914HLQ2_GLORO
MPDKSTHADTPAAMPKKDAARTPKVGAQQWVPTHPSTTASGLGASVPTMSGMDLSEQHNGTQQHTTARLYSARAVRETATSEYCERSADVFYIVGVMMIIPMLH